MESTWDVIKKIYENKFGVSGKQVDYVAVNEILKMCVSGISNAKIGYSLDQEVNYVSEVIYDHLGFNGWETDLDISPWRIYCKNAGVKFAFESEIQNLTNLLNSGIIDLAYRICSIYESIRKEIEYFYECS